MKPFALPWLELAIIIPLVGAIVVCLFQDVRQASKWCLGFITVSLACSVMAVAGYFNHQTSIALPWGLGSWNGQRLLEVDELNALLLPLVALLHFLTALTTSRMMMAGFSFGGLLSGAAIRLAAFACVASCPLVMLLALEAALPLVTSRKPGGPSRVYLLQTLLFIILLGLGWTCIDVAQLTSLGSVLIILVGSLYITEYRGFYEQTPSLAVIFLITGLAAVGFPGTSGFVAIELLVDEAVGAHVAVGLVVVLAAAMNGIAIVRTYLLLFTGRRHVTGVSLKITPRERVAELTIVALIIGGGLVPQTDLESRHRAVGAILRDWSKLPELQSDQHSTK